VIVRGLESLADLAFGIPSGFAVCSVQMMEEEEEGGGRMAVAAVYPNVYVFERSLLASLVGVEELGPLRAMTATGVSLSLALNTAVASTDHLVTMQRISFVVEEAEG
jgi:hypothetical protein